MEISRNTATSVLLVGVLMGLVASSQAYDFYVGGRDGWVSNPSESYSSWAGRNRFQINDTLVFKYKSGADSVLVVTKQAYETCNLSNPVQKLEGGNSAFSFDRSGPFYFISGVAEKCHKGQKLVVVVLADRSKKRSQASPSPSSLPPISHSPSPAVQAGTPSSPSPSSLPPISRSPAPAVQVSSPSSATPALAPASSPVSSPSSTSPAASPSSIWPALSPSTSPVSNPSSISPDASPSSMLPAPQNSPGEPSSAAALSPPSPSPSSPSAVSRVTASTITLELVAMVLGGALLY